MPRRAPAHLGRLLPLAATLLVAACDLDGAVATAPAPDDAAALATAGGTAAEPGRIVYTASAGPNANRAMSVRADGSDPRPLFGARQPWAWVVSLAYSPTRDRILYHGDGTLYVAGLDGTDAVEIGHDSLDTSTHVHWSPDGRFVLGTRFWPRAADGRGGTVFVMRTDGSGVARLPVGTSDYARWTPDALIAVQGDLDRGEGWEHVSLDGAVVRRYSAREQIALRQRMEDTSPDGRFRAFVSFRSGIHLIDQVTGDTTRILDRRDVSLRVRWSPDGRHLAALAECGPVGLQAGELLVVAADGSGARTVARDVFCRGGFDW